MYNCEAVVNGRERVRIYTCAWAACRECAREAIRGKEEEPQLCVVVRCQNCNAKSFDVIVERCSVDWLHRFHPGDETRERERESFM